MYGAGDEKLVRWLEEIQQMVKELDNISLIINQNLNLLERVQRAAVKKWLKGIDGGKLYIRNNHNCFKYFITRSRCYRYEESTIFIR